MWNWLLNTARTGLTMSAEYLQNQSFLEQLLQLEGGQALHLLQEHVRQLDDAGYQALQAAFGGMIGTMQQQIRALEATSRGSAWGERFEDQIAYLMASGGAPPPSHRQALNEANARLQSLFTLQLFADQVRLSMRPSHPAAPPPPHPGQEELLALFHRKAEQFEERRREPPPEPPAGPEELKASLLREAGEGTDDRRLLARLRQLFQAEVDAGAIGPERQQLLSAVLGELGEVMDTKPEGLPEMMAQETRVRKLLERMTPAVLDPGAPAGAPRPAAGSRAERVAGLLKGVEAFLLTEARRPHPGDEERAALEKLHLAGVHAKTALREATDDDSALELERELLRPHALEARRFALRTHLLLADPIWPTPPVTRDASAVFFSGSPALRTALGGACARLRLRLLDGEADAAPAQARWDDLRAAHVAVFDFTGFEYRQDERDLEAAGRVAAVAYELGIALALGHAVVVLGRPGRPMPFDVDLHPVLLEDDGADPARLADALDYALYGQQRGGADSALDETVRHLERRFGGHPNWMVRQALKMVDDEVARDPIKLRAVLEHLLAFAGPEAPRLLLTAYPGDYPRPDEPRCFHVMPFREWSDYPRRVVEEACRKADPAVRYVRGDQEVLDADIIRSIWNNLCRATHVVVDLTGFNPNVALELGVAHTLGRNTLLVAQHERPERFFPRLGKVRILSYAPPGAAQPPGSLETLAARFLGAG